MHKKKLLIIGAGIYQKPLIEYASTVCDVLVAAPVISEDFAPFILKSFICDVTDKEKILDFAKRERINGVITDQTDIAVRTVAYVAERMGLPGIGYETACLFTDKNLMRKKLKTLGIKTLPYTNASDINVVQEFFESNGCSPIILKPSDSQGSRGVSVCRSEVEIRSAFEEALKFSKSKSVVVERFATGREFVIESLCFNYEYVPLIYGDSHYFNIKNMFAPYERVFPSDVDEMLKEKLLKLNEKIITGFGLKQGIAHSEYIMDGEEIYLIETAARGGGVFISSDLIPIGAGVRTEEFLVNIALGLQKTMPQMEYKGKCCAYMAFLLPSGEVVSVKGVDEVKKLPYVRRNLLGSIYVGKTTGYTYDKTARYAIILEADNRIELSKRIEHIKNLLNIQVIDDDGKMQSVIFE